ncbi:MAG: hypothetical protein KC620_11785 [Myxococcales bacterium]|nr:hypothetical protein [Myxococcales bacterium]
MVTWTPETERVAFVDADRIHRTLEAAARAPNLYEVAVNRFSEEEGAPAEVIDEGAFDYLIEEAFIELPHEVLNEIERSRMFEAEAERTRSQLEQLLRQIRTKQLMLRRVEGEVDRGFLKSKTRKWDEEIRRDTLKAEIGDLQLKKRRMESELERTGTQLRGLLDRIYADQRLREARWYGHRPILVTHHGFFLLDYLSDLNPAHFRGRTLSEIIEIGPSLA